MILSSTLLLSLAPPPRSSSHSLFWTTDQVHTFDFHAVRPPLSHWSAVLMGCLVYLLIVCVLKVWVIARGEPFKLRFVVVVWNWFCSIASLYLLFELSVEMLQLFSHHSAWSLICDESVQHTRGKHQFLIYVVYLTKYVELIDTFLLCLRDKPLQFIHVYHHAVTIVFAFIHLQARTCIVWCLPLLNLSIHVVLYAYFALHEMGIDMRQFKRYLTLMQVGQFYITLMIGLTVLLPRILYAVNPALPGAYACRGTWPATIVGIAILLSYLILFQNLYRQRYKQPRRDNKGKAKIQPIAVKELNDSMLGTECKQMINPTKQLTMNNMWPVNCNWQREFKQNDKEE